MVDKKKRKLLAAAGAGSLAGLVGLSFHYGLRYPPLSFDVPPVPKKQHIDSAHYELNGAIFVSSSNGMLLRAFTPQPMVTVRADIDQTVTIEINNVFPEAELEVTGVAGLAESTQGISRLVIGEVKSGQEATFAWRLPDDAAYRFAIIGDTGGDRELNWCLKRAKELGAQFLLHLGDFNYQPGDYDDAIREFHNAPLPCFVTIGNHDYHDDGGIYPKFQQNIGPLNYQFTLGDTPFVNSDTAADFFPAWGGVRGKLMETLIAEKDQHVDTVLFTHRPFVDPRPNETHYVGGVGERDWLSKAFLEANIDKFFAGHIHIQHEELYNGVLNIIAGQGLGHQDIIAKQSISKMIIAQTQPGQKIQYDWHDLAMPLEYHCSERHHRFVRENTGFEETKNVLEKACF